MDTNAMQSLLTRSTSRQRRKYLRNKGILRKVSSIDIDVNSLAFMEWEKICRHLNSVINPSIS